MEPWLGGKKPNSLSVSFYHTIQSYNSAYSNYGSYGGYNNQYSSTASDRKMKITGASVGLGRRLKWPDDYFTLYNEVSYRRYDLNNYPLYGTNMTNGTSNQLSFNTVFGRSSVSQPLYPRFGSDFSLGFEFSLPFSLWNGKDYSDANENIEQEKYKWLEYYKWTFKASWFTSIIGDLVLNAKTEYGLVGFYNSNIGASPFEGYILGGDGMSYRAYGGTTIGLRGYENASLTVEGGANMYSKFALEVRYPLTLSQSATIYALTFLEAGKGWNNFSKFNPFGLYRSGGVGVRVFLPMLGLLGIDWAYGFDKVPGQTEVSGSQFHFVLGQQF